MKKTLTVGGSLLLFCAGWASGQNAAGPKYDGSAWNNLRNMDVLAQTLYTSGYVAGYRRGSVVDWVIHGSGKPSPLENSKIARLKIESHDLNGLGKNRHVTVAEVQEAMDTFYNDYRNVPVCWDDALVFSVESLNDDAPTEQELDATRKANAETGCTHENKGGPGP